jgi:lipopolysaccharide export LptBFGC system permease protein LptF
VLAFVAVLAVFLLGVWLGGVPGAAMLVALAGGAGVLLAATWPRLSAPERTVRLLVIVVVLGIALERLA